MLARTYLPPSTNKEPFERWFVEAIESIVPGIPVKDIVYSFDLLASGRALIAFARLPEIEKQSALLKQCSIIPLAIDAACLALYDAFSLHPWVKTKENFAIVDIGSRSSDLLIVKDGEPFGANEINFGGKDLMKGKERHKKFATELGVNLARVFNHYEEKDNVRIQDLLIVGDYANLPVAS